MRDPDVPVMLLDPSGDCHEHPDYEIGLSADEIRGVYRDMVMLRRIDIEGTALQRQGELGIWVPCLGQEASQAGSARALGPGDMVFPTYREHGLAWLRGVPLPYIVGIYRGTTNGGWDPDAHGVAHFTIVIGDQCPHAVGYSMGMQRDGADAATIVFFGDGASSQGDVHESMVFASVFNTPTVFFCQNNHWAISVPLDRQARVPIHRRADSYGMPGVRVDGNDVLAVHAVTRAALAAAREGQGPWLIEAVTYRMGAHTTSDDPTRYRTLDELDDWRQRDPIDRVARYLRRIDAVDDAFFAEVDAEADDLGSSVRQVVRSLPQPGTEAMFAHAYAEPHPVITAEREWLSAYEASFVEGEARS